MKLEVLKQNGALMRSVRNNLSYNEFDTSNDEQIASMSREELFTRYCDWNGLINWGPRILNAYDTISLSLKDDGNLSFDLLSENDTDGGIVENLRKRLGFPEYDDADFDGQKFASKVEQLDLRDALSEYLAWNAILGYENSLMQVINTIKKAQD